MDNLEMHIAISDNESESSIDELAFLDSNSRDSPDSGSVPTTADTYSNATSSDHKSDSEATSAGPEDSGQAGDIDEAEEPGSEENSDSEEDSEEGKESGNEFIRFTDREIEDLESMDYGSIGDMFALKRQDGIERIREIFPISQSLYEFQQNLTSYLKDPKGREIRAVYDKEADDFIFNTSPEIDMVPLLVSQLSTSYKQLAANLFKPAPTLGSQTPYPCFDYERDTLVLYYGYCGEESADSQKFKEIIKRTVRSIQNSAKRNSHEQTLKYIEVTYCHQMVEDDLPVFVNWFRRISCLQNLTLYVHNHYKNMNASVAQNLMVDEEVSLAAMANTGVLKAGAYPFTVKLVGCCGYDYEQDVEESEAESEAEDEDTDEAEDDDDDED